MIPFPHQIKITHSDFCYYGIYILKKIDIVEAFFISFFASIIKALGRMV